MRGARGLSGAPPRPAGVGAPLLLAALALAGCAPALQQQGAPVAPRRGDKSVPAPGAPAKGYDSSELPRLTEGARSDGSQPISERPEWMRTLALPDLPLRWYPRVTQYLEQYRSEPRSREIIRGWLRRLGPHRAVMEAALAREGLPKGLLFVAMIESGFNASAISSRGAGGFWQFIPSVARAYGMEVSFWVDERRDLEKSSTAAAKYLGDLQHRFGSWELALAGYNAGPFAVLQSIARFNTNDYGTLCRVESGLPWETTEYVPKVLAVGIVERNRRAFGFDEATGDSPVNPPPFETAVVPPATSFETLSVRVGVTTEELAALNPSYLRGRTPPDREGVVLRFPSGKAQRVASAGLGSQTGELVATRVRPGETLVRLAKSRKIPVDRLRRLNAVFDDADVTPGTLLLVPRARPERPATPTAVKRQAAAPSGAPARR